MCVTGSNPTKLGQGMIGDLVRKGRGYGTICGMTITGSLGRVTFRLSAGLGTPEPQPILSGISMLTLAYSIDIPCYQARTLPMHVHF